MHVLTTAARLAATVLFVTAVRIQDLRKRRPVEHVGLAQVLLHDLDERSAYSAILFRLGIVHVPVDRLNGRQTIGNVDRKLNEFDGKFAKAAAAYVRSVTAGYNAIVHRYLSAYGSNIAADMELYARAFRAIEFDDKSDGFAVISYLNDTGSDPEPVCDFVLFYTAPRVRPTVTVKPRPRDQILAISRSGLDPRVAYKLENDIDVDTERMADELSAMESDLHRFSGKFSRGFGQWFRVYRYDEIEDAEDTSGVRRDYARFKYSVTCKIWVNILKTEQVKDLFKLS